MAIGDFQASKWTAKVELLAQEKSIVSTITNQNYQIDANGAKSVVMNLVDDITIGTYTPGSDITVTPLDDTQKILTMDQAKYFAFPVDIVDKTQSTADFMNAAMTQAGQKIALTADNYVFGSNTYGDADIPSGNKIGSVGSPETINSSNVLSKLYAIAEIMDGQNIPRDDNRWVAIPPWFNTKLAIAGVAKQTDNMKTFSFGVVRQVAGLNIVMSNQLTALGTGTDEYQILAFSGRAIPFATSVQKLQIMDMENQFAQLVKGLFVFGSKVLFPKEVCLLVGQEAAEA